MTSFDDPTEKLLELKAKREAKAAGVTEPVNTEADPKIPATEVLNKETNKKEEAVPSEPVEKAPIVDEKKEETSTTNPPESDSEGEPVFEWDADEKPTTQSLDLKKIGSALNLEVNSEEEFVQTVSDRLSKLKDYEAKLQDEVLPDDFKSTFEEAKELAKAGGDWQTLVYNSMLDASKLDPVKLYESEFERSEAYRFKKEDGTVDYDALWSEHDSIPESVRKNLGNQIKQNLSQRQTQQKQAVLEQAKKAQDQFNRGIVEAAKDLPSQFPSEVYGIKVEPSHAAAIQNEILNGKLVKEYLGVDYSALIKAGADPKKVMATLAKAKYSKQLAEFNRKLGVTKARKELLEKTQNPQITSTGVAPEPNEVKPKSRADIIKEQMQINKPANSL